MIYATVVDVNAVTVGEMPDLLRLLRECALASWSDGDAFVQVAFEVGPGARFADLWDLHAAVTTLNVELASYGAKAIGKPVATEIEEHR